MKQRLNRNKMVPVLLAAAVVLSATSIPYSEVHAKTSAPAAHQKSSAKTLKPVWQKIWEVWTSLKWAIHSIKVLSIIMPALRYLRRI